MFVDLTMMDLANGLVLGKNKKNGKFGKMMNKG
jgi:hypothetical protein